MKISKERIRYEIAENFADATSMVTLTMPINSAIELFGAGMSADVSLASRGYNVAVAYGGLTRVVKLRDYTKRKFDIDNCPRAVRNLHDVAYGVVLGPLIKSGVYWAAGETDWKKIAIGVAGTMLIAGALSVPIGWMFDVGRDLWGVKPSVRTPEKWQTLSSRDKKKIPLKAMAASIAVTGLLYGAGFYRDKVREQNNLESSGIEQVVESVGK